MEKNLLNITLTIKENIENHKKEINIIDIRICND